MEITGAGIKYIRRNEKTGESTLLVRTDAKDIFCNGIMQLYPAYTPLCLTGEYTSENSFIVTSAKVNITNKEQLKKFFSSDYFSGIGEVGAEKLANNLISNPSLLYSNSLTGLSDAAIKAIRKVKGLMEFDELYQYIESFGGRYYSACGAFRKYRENTLQYIKKYPYCLLMFDTSLAVCEKIAKENKIEYCQKERIHSVVKDALIKNHSRGNTRISFSALCEMIHKEETAAECEFFTNPLFIAEEVLEEDYFIEYTNSDTFIYLLHDYQAEMQIVSNIRRLQQTSIQYENPLLPLYELERKFSIQYSEEQKESFSVINSSGIKIITGGPGTGKTTLLNGLLEKFRANHPDKIVTLCAPTGCAAKRMRETTGMTATTIHKLLQIKPFEKKELYRSQKISADCLIVDECSMIDSFLMAQLLSAVKNEALVIFLGDKDQLPSVEAGDVLRDFIMSEIIEVHHLHTIFRQLSENAIIKNSKNVIQGIPDLKENNQFKIMHFNTEEELVKEATDIARKCFLHNIKNVKVYSPVKKIKFQSGTINMNRAIQDERNKLIDDISSQSQLEYGFYRFYVGDEVVFTRNNYEKGYYNGQEGTITCIQNHTDTTRITIATEEESITVSGMDINDIELNYAVTAHKSQGGECDNAVILIPQKPKSMLQRKILYVEITRAKKNVIILSEQDALERTISNYMEAPRQTGLKEKLAQIY